MERGGDTKKPLPVIIIKPDRLAGMLNQLVNQFGSAGLSMIYSIGRYNGSYEAEDLLKDVKNSDKKFTRRELLKNAFERMAKMGWAKIEVEEYDMLSGEGILSSPYHLFSSSCESPNSAGCFFIRGLLSALLSNIMEMDATCEAISCDSEGEGRCLFKISRS